MNPITERERDIAHQAALLAGILLPGGEILPVIQEQEIVTRLRSIDLAPLLAQAIMPMYGLPSKPALKEPFITSESIRMPAPRFCDQCGSVQHGTSPCPQKEPVKLREGCPECGRMKPCHAPGCGRDPDRPKPAKPRRWIVEFPDGIPENGLPRLIVPGKEGRYLREVKPVKHYEAMMALAMFWNPSLSHKVFISEAIAALKRLGIEVEE